MYKVLVQKAALVETQQSAAGHSAAISQATPRQPIKTHQKTLLSSFSKSGKQGGGAAVLGEGHDIVTRESCIPTSLNLNLGKAAVLLCALSCCWGCANSACDY
jgi:hypothetical protein